MEQATLIYALYLGIDLEEEKELIIIAEQALKTLPKNWVLGFGDDDSEHPGVPYFYNSVTDESAWTHPKEDVYFQLVKREREQLQQQRDKNKAEKSSSSSYAKKDNKAGGLSVQDEDSLVSGVERVRALT